MLLTNLFLISFILKAVEIEELEGEESGGENELPKTRKIKEHRVPIDHESFYDGRVFGETKSRATVHMEVNTLLAKIIYQKTIN